jgi:hypothetical protein
MNRRVTQVTNDENHWGMYEHLKPAYAWLKKNLTTVAICCSIGYALGYHRAESTIELDCKYAKSIRLSSTAFKCERII